MSPTASTVRRLTGAAIAAQVAFTAAWIVGGALQGEYSHIDQSVSELGARFADDPWVVNTGLIVFGLSVCALAPGLVHVLPRRPAATVAAVLFVVVGAVVAANAFLPLDCSFAQQACRDRFGDGELSWQTYVHSWSGLLMLLALLATPFAIARALWTRPTGLLAPSPVAIAALACGLIGLAIGAAGLGLEVGDAGRDGLNQRLRLGVMHLWLVLVAAGILHEASRDTRPTDPAPLPPRQFFGRRWSGDGEVVLRPLFLGRRFARRLRFQREADWISDEVCVLEDRATFSNGSVAGRRMLCGFLEPGRAEVATLDPPHAAAEITFDEAGYRVSPYDVAIPLGPIALTLRCRDQHRVESDGTLVDTIDARLLGVPVARATLRARFDSTGAVERGRRVSSPLG